MSTVGLKVIKNKEKKSADIWIYQDIGEGWFEGFTAKDFSDQIKEIGDVDTIHVYLNSPGGDVFDGVAIYNILRRHKAEVLIEIDALAASIASVIAMAGDQIWMAENAMMMVHNPWGMAIGDATTMRKAADDIDKVREASIIPAYARKTKLDKEKIAELMDAETWMSAAEAEDFGFIDGVTAEKKMAASVDMEKLKQKYKYNPPKMKAEEPKEDEQPVEVKEETPEPKAEAKTQTPRLDDWRRILKDRKK